jgi:hypothetical protein
MKAEKILNEREGQYGNYAFVSSVAQNLKQALRLGVGWNELTGVQKESLELIATKLSRVVSGNPNWKDSWEDIGGYAQLVVDDLEGVNRAELSKKNGSRVSTIANDANRFDRGPGC